MSIDFSVHGQTRGRPAAGAIGGGFGVKVEGGFAQAGARLGQAIVGRNAAGQAARVLVLCAALCAFAFNAGQASVTAASRPRGLMYDVGGGRRMRLVCEGPSDSSKPTVLFESGAFGFSGDWSNVQAQVTAQGLRSCAYDRAGMGLSDPARGPRDGVAAARDLETLLAVAHAPGPYILVGHSMAGARVHLFANRNRDKVAGLVLVDSTTPEAMADPEVGRYVADFTGATHMAALTARFGILKLLAGTALGDKVGLPPEEDLEKRWQFASARYNRTAYEEVRNWPLVARQALKTGPLDPAWPVAVVSAGVFDTGEGHQMQALQPPPALASRHGYVAVVDGATHNALLGPKYSPAIVQGIDFVMAAATARGPDAERPGLVLRNTMLASR
jgi:pimeloyl-ACP methyl ester carboxylesterase